jgi:hypothetical protein
MSEVVTPKTNVNRCTIGQEYKVKYSYEDHFILVDDFGIEKVCYWSDFTVITKPSFFSKICNFVNKILGI